MNNPVKLWRNKAITRKLLGKTGIVIGYTVIYQSQSHFEAQAPYVVALVSVGKTTFIGQIVDHDDKKNIKGRKVQAVMRRLYTPAAKQVIPYGIKFRLI